MFNVSLKDLSGLVMVGRYINISKLNDCVALFYNEMKFLCVILYSCILLEINKECNLMCNPDVSFDVRKGQPGVGTRVLFH